MKSKGVLTASDNDMQGRLGVHLTGLHVHAELEWIFREKPTSDIGIDGEIELRNAKGESHGRIIALQIKCAPSYLIERTVSGITYRGDYAHLKYWSNFAVPVVIVLCDPASSKCWWQLVDMARIAFHAKGWSIEVPHSNLLNAAAKPALELVAGRLQRKDFVELALRDWIGWRFEHKMRLASLLDLPRDYHWFSHLGSNRRPVLHDRLPLV